ncbi:27801_t:CDS:1, partial [Dentiscutata erythropus]
MGMNSTISADPNNHETPNIILCTPCAWCPSLLLTTIMSSSFDAFWNLWILLDIYNHSDK